MIFLDTKTGKKETLLQMTSNSYLLTQTKIGKNGINCTHWFDKKSFEERFKTIK